jgi:hypothetical protein
MVEVLGKLDWHAPEVEAAIYYCCREPPECNEACRPPSARIVVGPTARVCSASETHHPVRMMSRLDP